MEPRTSTALVFVILVLLGLIVRLVQSIFITFHLVHFARLLRHVPVVEIVHSMDHVYVILDSMEQTVKDAQIIITHILLAFSVILPLPAVLMVHVPLMVNVIVLFHLLVQHVINVV